MSEQYFVRVSEETLAAFKTRCEDQGHMHTEIMRFLIGEYAAGRLSLSAQITQPTASTLENALR